MIARVGGRDSITFGGYSSWELTATHLPNVRETQERSDHWRLAERLEDDGEEGSGCQLSLCLQKMAARTKNQALDSSPFASRSENTIAPTDRLGTKRNPTHAHPVTAPTLDSPEQADEADELDDHADEGPLEEDQKANVS